MIVTEVKFELEALIVWGVHGGKLILIMQGYISHRAILYCSILEYHICCTTLPALSQQTKKKFQFIGQLKTYVAYLKWGLKHLKRVNVGN